MNPVFRAKSKKFEGIAFQLLFTPAEESENVGKFFRVELDRPQKIGTLQWHGMIGLTSTLLRAEMVRQVFSFSQVSEISTATAFSQPSPARSNRVSLANLISWYLLTQLALGVLCLSISYH